MAISNSSVELRSVYVAMPDGVRLAVDIWLPKDLSPGDKLPTFISFTRYWRSYDLGPGNLELQPTYENAAYLTSRGYAFVMVDGRGSGASFGSRTTEYSPQETGDFQHVIDWVAHQPWSNGRVAATGTSYLGNTAFMAAKDNPPPLKIVAPNSADFDGFHHVLCPGGIPHTWLIERWGAAVGAMDRNDIETRIKHAEVPPPEEFVQVARGVRPVGEDKDGSLLKAAVAEHAANFNIAAGGMDPTYRDADREMPDTASVFLYKEAIEKSGLPIFYRTGWQDAGTAEGAVCLFNTFSNPMCVMIGPWNHGMSFRADPFQPGDEGQPLPLEEKLSSIVGVVEHYVSGDAGSEQPEMGVLEYYTLGENKWKTTRQWPLPDTTMKRLYLAGDRSLSETAPTDKTGQEVYKVDPDATTGKFNRWHTQMGAPVHHPDRREADERLLVYDTAPLEEDVEVTGHPLVRLFVRSTAADGAFFAYLEAVGPDGRVRLLTEGYLRGLHRKVSGDQPPYWIYGPYHSYKRADAAPMVPGRVEELYFSMYPISVVFSKGHRIRLAIAGADKDTFGPIPGAEAPEIRVERNRVYASHLELPVIPR